MQKNGKTQMVGGTFKKIISTVIFIGAIAFASAPFLHKIYPIKAKEKIQLEEEFTNGKISLNYYNIKKDELKQRYSFNGFTNKRRFVLAMGLPLSLFGCSFLFAYFVRFIEEKRIRRQSGMVAYIFMFTGCYFIFWNLWWFNTNTDFPRWAYYLSLGLMSIVTVFSVRIIISGLMKEFSVVKKLRFRISNLYRINNMVFKFIFDETDKEGYIKPEKIVGYRKRRVEIANESIEIEQED